MQILTFITFEAKHSFYTWSSPLFSMRAYCTVDPKIDPSALLRYIQFVQILLRLYKILPQQSRASRVFSLRVVVTGWTSSSYSTTASLSILMFRCRHCYTTILQTLPDTITNTFFSRQVPPTCAWPDDHRYQHYAPGKLDSVQ